MSNSHAATTLICWSPSAVSSVSPTGETRTGRSISEVSSGSNGPSLVLLERNCCFVRSVRVPNISVHELEPLLPRLLVDEFPLQPSQLAYDIVLSNEVNQDGRLGTIVAASTEAIQQIQEEAKAAGVTIAGILPISFGSKIALEHSKLSVAGVVQNRSNHVGLDVISNGALIYSRAISPGLPLEDEICRTFNSAKVPCEPVYSFARMDGIETNSLNEDPLLAFFSIDIRHLPANIELTETKQSRSKQGTARSQRQAAAVAAIALVLAGLSVARYVTAKVAVNSEIASKLAEVQKYKDKANTVQKNVEQSASLITALDRSFAPAQNFSDVISVLCTDAPQAVWIENISLEKGKEFTVRGTAMTSQDVANYVTTLSGENRFRNIRLLYSNNANVGHQAVVQFSITGFPVGNLPFIDDSKNGAPQ